MKNKLLSIVEYSQLIHKNTSKFTFADIYKYICWLEHKNKKSKKNN